MPKGDHGSHPQDSPIHYVLDLPISPQGTPQLANIDNDSSQTPPLAAHVDRLKFKPESTSSCSAHYIIQQPDWLTLSLTVSSISWWMTHWPSASTMDDLHMQHSYCDKSTAHFSSLCLLLSLLFTSSSHFCFLPFVVVTSSIVFFSLLFISRYNVSTMACLQAPCNKLLILKKIAPYVISQALI